MHAQIRDRCCTVRIEMRKLPPAVSTAAWTFIHLQRLGLFDLHRRRAYHASQQSHKVVIGEWNTVRERVCTNAAIQIRKHHTGRLATDGNRTTHHKHYCIAHIEHTCSAFPREDRTWGLCLIITVNFLYRWCCFHPQEAG